MSTTYDTTAFRAAIVAWNGWADLCEVVDPVDETRWVFRIQRLEDYAGETQEQLGLRLGRIVLIATRGAQVVAAKLTRHG